MFLRDLFNWIFRRHECEHENFVANCVLVAPVTGKKWTYHSTKICIECGDDLDLTEDEQALCEALVMEKEIKIVLRNLRERILHAN